MRNEHKAAEARVKVTAGEYEKKFPPYQWRQALKTALSHYWVGEKYLEIQMEFGQDRKMAIGFDHGSIRATNLTVWLHVRSHMDKHIIREKCVVVNNNYPDNLVSALSRLAYSRRVEPDRPERVKGVILSVSPGSGSQDIREVTLWIHTGRLLLFDGSPQA